MLQASLLDGLSFDPFSLQEDGLAAAEVDIGRCEIVEALVIAPVIVVVDERPDLGFEIARQVVVLQEDPVLEGLMPALDLALGLRMVGGTADVRDVALAEPGRELARDVARAIVGEQPWPMDDFRLVAAGGLEGQLQRVGDVTRLGYGRNWVTTE